MPPTSMLFQGLGAVNVALGAASKRGMGSGRGCRLRGGVPGVGLSVMRDRGRVEDDGGLELCEGSGMRVGGRATSFEGLARWGASLPKLRSSTSKWW